jgi:transcription elongation factor Elf1
MTRKTSKPMWEGVKLLCPVCGETAATINLDLSSMMLTCESCDDSFAVNVACKLVSEHLGRWEAVREWIETASEFLAPVQRDCDALPSSEPCVVCTAEAGE